ncbi:MAG: hypothetical protein PHT78_11350 [Desulfitobacteriaceae bacterium]|nr:hypothetical protein [Desulfitobacteriaceae bacterium]
MTDEQFRVIQADIEEIKKANDSRLENTLSVSTLNAFYSALFTAIAVIVAIIALISWQGLNKKIEESENVINKYITIEPDIDYLLKKVKYAEWVQRKFTSEDIEYSYDLNFNDEDEAMYNEMESHITNLHEEDAWMEMIIAHEHIFEKGDIEEAEKIYKFIESRNIFPDNSKVEPLLYHLLGQLYKKKYDDLVDQNNNFKAKENILIEAEKYYKKSLDTRKEKEKQRTRSNLAVIYIELGKQELKQFYKTGKQKHKNKSKDYLHRANYQLNEAEKQGPDYNVYWDQARVAFYLDDGNSKKMSALLIKATNIIHSPEAKEAFVDKLYQEIDEFKEYNQKGFPGDKKIIHEIKVKLRRA